MQVAGTGCNAANPDSKQTVFLALLPKIEQHARIYFRGIACPDTKADKIAETVALAWAWYVRLTERGKDVAAFPMVFIFLVARAVRCGRRVCGQEKANEVMSPFAQQRHRIKVQGLNGTLDSGRVENSALPKGQHLHETYEEYLRDNTMTPPPDAAAFRIDFPQFLFGLDAREKEMGMLLAQGESVKTVAGMFGISSARVSQLRKTWLRDWHAFHNDDDFTSSVY
jgi:hypothetical protein